MKHAILLVLPAMLVLPGCRPPVETEAAERVVARYNQLLAEGYRTLDMNGLQEVATPELATKAYFHMAAIGEGRLRIEATPRDLQVTKVEGQGTGALRIETREVWDFTHVEIATGTTFAQEKGFVYTMGYELAREPNGWRIVDVTTISGDSTDAVVPWPHIDREGRRSRPPAGAK